MLRFAIIIFIFFTISKAAQEGEGYSPVSFLEVFDGIFLNAGKAFIFNYGVNSALMAGGTYGMVETGVDWKWRQFAYNHDAVSYAGAPAVFSGSLVPIALPLTLYGVGRGYEDTKMQTAGVALAQAVILSTSLTTGIKAFTSRREPHIWGDDKQVHDEDLAKDFKFGFLRRIPFDGWPSGHTSAAWTIAATLTEFYPDNTLLAVGLYSYAVYMGLGVSTTIHWLSDAWAGALFGYAIGKTVARHFMKEESSPYSLVFVPNGIGICYRF